MNSRSLTTVRSAKYPWAAVVGGISRWCSSVGILVELYSTWAGSGGNFFTVSSSTATVRLEYPGHMFERYIYGTDITITARIYKRQNLVTIQPSRCLDKHQRVDFRWTQHCVTYGVIAARTRESGTEASSVQYRAVANETAATVYRAARDACW